MRTPSRSRHTAIAVAAVLTLAACGGDESKQTAGGTTPASVSETDTTSDAPVESPPTSSGGPTETVATAAPTAGDECYGAVSAASLSEIAGPDATPLTDVVEPFPDTSRGTVVCFQQFLSAPDARVGDTDAYLGVTMADSSRFIDAFGEPVTFDVYRDPFLEATPFSIGDEGLTWGQADDTDYRHYRYLAFKKGDLVVMVYAGVQPYQPATDWATADALMQQWITELAQQIAASPLTAADLPAQNVVVPATTAPQP